MDFTSFLKEKFRQDGTADAGRFFIAVNAGHGVSI